MKKYGAKENRYYYFGSRKKLKMTQKDLADKLYIYQIRQ